MYEEPYRWVEAVRNRREYLEEQLSAGGPIVAFPYEHGALLATLGGGTPKLYEVYDRIAFGGMGHPADLEKLRNVVLDTAHVEGFNRSPADVTVQRLMKFGLAPMVKQAFEEILHAPYICKIVMAELSFPSGAPQFFQLNYDGVFEERAEGLILAPTTATAERMEAYFKEVGDTRAFSLKEALKAALRTWAVSQWTAPETEKESAPKPNQLDLLLKKSLEDRTVDAVLLDRTLPGSSKYRALSKEEIQTLTHGWLK